MSCALSLLGADVGIEIGADAIAGSSVSNGADSAIGAVAGALVSVDACVAAAVVPAGASKPYGR